MYCKNCGSQISDNAYVCPHCGVLTNGAPVPARAATQETNNVLAIIGFILSFFIAIAGLVCSILGLKKANELDGKGHGLALAGLIISIVSIVLSFLLIIIYASVLAAIL